ncbi:MAG: peptidylprolyl isomerase [Anaerolineae bacterium]
MARRRQTTGMPRKDRQKDDIPENPSFLDNLLGNPTTRAEREDALNRLIQRGIASIVGVIVVVVLAILAYEFLVVPQLTVATVNDDRITVGEFRQRVDFERALTVQNYNIRVNQLQQQAQSFGVDVNQLAQQDQQLTRWGQELQSDDILGNRVINEMVDDLLIAQEFEAQSLTLDDAQIDFARQEFFGFDPTQAALIGTPATATVSPTPSATPLVSPTPSPTPLPTNTPTVLPSPIVDPEATAEVTEAAEVTEQPTIPPTPTTSQTEAFENYEESIELFEESVINAEASRAGLEAFWEREAIRLTVQQSIVGEIETALHANARHILVDTEAEALAIIDALQAGESFAALAQAQSTDTGSAQRGGELGWQPIDLYVAPFADAIRDGEIGALLGPVESQFGFHIIQVIATEERPVSEQVVQQLTQSRFNTWLEDRREEADAADAIAINQNWPDLLR